jgi:hypothetical protein
MPMNDAATPACSGRSRRDALSGLPRRRTAAPRHPPGRTSMHTRSFTIVEPAGRAVDPWSLLTGGSVGWVAGFAADLLRLGLHGARHALASGRATPASSAWRCPHGCG